MVVETFESQSLSASSSSVESPVFSPLQLLKTAVRGRDLSWDRCPICVTVAAVAAVLPALEYVLFLFVPLVEPPLLLILPLSSAPRAISMLFVST